ncbi:MAG: four helix bundle protein, partial [Candidatus Omnitrophica bacterium]|nr:four helix bundle protein [Candidatus Omnitrophota bacterium]
EGVNRALSEVHEIEHHLDVAVAKKYIVREKHSYFITKYDECGKMLKGLIRSLENMRQ